MGSIAEEQLALQVSQKNEKPRASSKKETEDSFVHLPQCSGLWLKTKAESKKIRLFLHTGQGIRRSVKAFPQCSRSTSRSPVPQ